MRFQISTTKRKRSWKLKKLPCPTRKNKEGIEKSHKAIKCFSLKFIACPQFSNNDIILKIPMIDERLAKEEKEIEDFQKKLEKHHNYRLDRAQKVLDELDKNMNKVKKEEE
ncbi:MAG: hypothetical protein mread185_000030 [Mycoplasmataceae bacterium]|nr:MAG: hypothetical protein mread185_000030 [Mycoplasmataceae bacterium]